MEKKIEKFACLQFKFLYHERHGKKKREREMLNQGKSNSIE